MIDLNKKEAIQQIDASGVYESVISLPAQAKQAWEEVSALDLPATYKECTNGVFLGMGGSNLGFHLIKQVFFDQMSIPVELVNGYRLPKTVGEQTLVIVSSYSGNTEETLHLAQLALERGAKLIAITTGGKLAQLANDSDFPVYMIDPKHNKAGQPRLGIGYSVFSQIGIFAKLGIITINEEEVQTIFTHFQELQERWQIESQEKNEAKELATQLHGKIPVWVAADHLVGNTRIAHNITNETPKCYSGFYAIPDLNHHLMEGLKNPHEAMKHITFLAFQSSIYHDRNQKRMEITKQVVEKNHVTWLRYTPQAFSALGQACEVLLLSNFIVFYLSMLYEEDPCPIPFVDFFKSELK